MENSFIPSEGQQAFTPELVRKIEDSVWGDGNRFGSIISEIASWFEEETPNGTVEEKLLIGFAVGKYVDAICTTEDHLRFFAVVFVV